MSNRKNFDDKVIYLEKISQELRNSVKKTHDFLLFEKHKIENFRNILSDIQANLALEAFELTDDNDDFTSH